jgi:cytochrome c oxidase assembly factor CtaG
VHRPSPRTGVAAPLDARAVLTAWNVEPALVVALGLAALVYVRGWRRLHARRPARMSVGRLAAFLGGLGALFVALASPLDTLADRSLAIHMTQHIVLLVVVPVLLLLGAPMVPLLHGLPAGGTRATLGALASRLADRLGHPLLGLLVMSLAMWGWHVPAAFELALASRAWHVAEHATFLGAGLLFWWPVVHPWPFRARWPRSAMIPYLLFADVQNTALAAILVFADRVLYPSYGRGPDALADQVVAGLLMWVPMSLAYLVPAAMLTARWLSPGGLGSARRMGAAPPPHRAPSPA